VVGNYPRSILIVEGDGKVSPQLWDLMVRGPINLEQKYLPDRPAEEAWITPTIWQIVHNLNDLSCFEGIAKDFVESSDAWEAYMKSPTPHTHSLPGKWSSSLDAFQKMVILRCLREDKLLYAFSYFVENNLGKIHVFHYSYCL
jgi:dynein heavy chain